MVYEGINIYNIFTVCNLLVIKHNTEIYSIQSDGKSGNADYLLKGYRIMQSDTVY